jgi:hypothetical protein
MILATLALVGALIGSDSSAVAQVFRGHGAAGYDQWLHRHATEYPGLRPIHVQIDSEVAGDSNKYTYHVSFLDDTGAIVRKRTFRGMRDKSHVPMEEPGKWLYAWTSQDGEELFLNPAADTVTVYGPRGDSMFTSTEGSVNGSSGLFFRQFDDGEGTVYRDYYDVLDRQGLVVSKIALGSLGEGEGLKTNHPFAFSRDTTYVMHAGLFVSVIDKHGDVLWQTKPTNYTAVAISDDGHTAAVATPESLVIRHSDSGRTSAFEFPEGRILDSLRATGSRVVPRGPFAIPIAAVSSDGSKVAVFRQYNYGGIGNGVLDVFSCDGKPAYRDRYLTPGLTQRMGFAGGGVVFVGDARPVTDSIVSGDPKHPRKYSTMVRWLITKADPSDDVSVTEVTVERTAVPKLTPNSVAFYGRDSIYVYRIRSTPSEQRK